MNGSVTQLETRDVPFSAAVAIGSPLPDLGARVGWCRFARWQPNREGLALSLPQWVCEIGADNFP